MKLKQFLKEGKVWGLVTVPAINSPKNQKVEAKTPIKEFTDATSVDMLDRDVSSLRKLVKSLESRVAALEKANKVK